MSVVGLARGVIMQALRDALDLSLGRDTVVSLGIKANL